ncbi:SGNH/GDSL hydrolase family protein [Alteromonas sp. CYL-A6]|uniref:SGNH/GDSL hydrolase family protein n=1 Tax=Alteromonas nitratireducens TaxID=3390813 RepID=UPI0034ADA880
MNRVWLPLLAPVMLYQGRRVRQRTPVLPEAGGARSGICGRGETRHLWVVGDSAAAGVGVALQKEALTVRLAERLADTHTVHWQCHAKTGLTLNDTVALLDSMDAQRVDTLVVSAGVNDVVHMRSRRRWSKALEQLAGLSREKFGVSQLVVCAIPPMEAFPALPWPLSAIMGARARRLNRLTRRRADALGFLFHDARIDVTGELMASDGFHPGPKGYQQWASSLAQRLAGTAQT